MDSDNNPVGELAFLEKTITGKDKKILICFTGQLLYALCYIFSSIGRRNKGVSSYLFWVGAECLRDLKTSIFLAHCGRHRQAMQVTRTAFESWLHALYFQSIDFLAEKRKDSNAQENNDKDFIAWVNGGSSKGDKLLIEFLYGTGIINYSDMKKYKKLYNLLSKHIHTIRETPTGEILRNLSREHIPCPASVYFDDEEFNSWLEVYQRMISIIVKNLLFFFPYIPKNKEGREGIAWIYQAYSTDVEFGAGWIVCDDFKDLIFNLPKIDFEEFGLEQVSIGKVGNKSKKK